MNLSSFTVPISKDFISYDKCVIIPTNEYILQQLKLLDSRIDTALQGRYLVGFPSQKEEIMHCLILCITDFEEALQCSCTFSHKRTSEDINSGGSVLIKFMIGDLQHKRSITYWKIGGDGKNLIAFDLPKTFFNKLVACSLLNER